MTTLMEWRAEDEWYSAAYVITTDDNHTILLLTDVPPSNDETDRAQWLQRQLEGAQE